jgi:hypothetical protein
LITRRIFSLSVMAAAAGTRVLRAAGVDGKWEASIESPMGAMAMTFDLKSDGEKLTGSVGNEMMGESEIQDGKISGDEVSFVQVMKRGDREMKFKYEGKLAGDKLELTRSMDGGGRGPGGGGERGPGGPGGGRGGRGGGGMGRPTTFTAKRVK